MFTSHHRPLPSVRTRSAPFHKTATHGALPCWRSIPPCWNGSRVVAMRPRPAATPAQVTVNNNSYNEQQHFFVADRLNWLGKKGPRISECTARPRPSFTKRPQHFPIQHSRTTTPHPLLCLTPARVPSLHISCSNTRCERRARRQAGWNW